MSKSYWIWKYGDYEIYHVMKVHLRREERGYHRPAVWKISTPSVALKFIKEFTCDKDGYMICHFNGIGHVFFDDMRYNEKVRIPISKGTHKVEVQVSSLSGLPSLFVDSDICPSDGSWTCNNFAGKLEPVGYNEHFTCVNKTPDVFPFSYENLTPVCVENVQNGQLFDFGKETFGFLNITNANPNDTIEVYYGESREEALDTDYTYITDSISGAESYKLKQRALRYVFLKNSSLPLSVSVDFEYLPLEKKGEFSCDNKLFNDICSLAQYTFHLNCREAFFDGLKRDRWVWSGDAYQSARINRYLFADKEIEQRTIIGLIGKLPIEQHINTIMDYSLLWIIGLYEHYFTYADVEFLQRIYPMAEKMLDFCETRLNKDGFLEGVDDDWTFIDWSDIDKEGAVCAEQILLIQTYKVMGEMSKILGLEKSEQFASKSEFLTKKVNEYYWNAEKGAFIDSYASGKNNVTRHANIFAVMYDVATKEQTESILTNVLKNENITKITTPYFAGYELDVLAKLSQFDAVENQISSYWGGMLDLGATTIWEEYCPYMQGAEHYAMYGGKYEKSLCHAWGAGPLYLFGRYYLGVQSTSAGYKTFTVEPRLGGLNEIKGKVPLNGGEVQIELTKTSLSVLCTKEGGTLIFNGEQYPLKANDPFTLSF